MNRGTMEQAVELTRVCLESFWQKDMAVIISRLADDVVWVGAQQEQFRTGKKETIEDFLNIEKNMQACHLRNMEFCVIRNDSRSCTVSGRYLVTTDGSAEYFLQAQQRCSFVWAKDGDGLKIRHIHMSNPIGELKVAKGEHFVNSMGRMAKRYLENQLHLLRDNRRITVTREDNAICFLYFTEIMYLEASRKTTYLYTRDGTVCARITFSEIGGRLPENFIQIHRSYIVNTGFVTQIKTNTVVMADGKEISVPVRRFRAVKEELMKEHGGE